jgi:hypothetical protein
MAANIIINLNDVAKAFATDLLNIVLFQLEQPYTSQSGKRFKGLDKSSALYKSVQVSYDATPIFKIGSLDYLQYLDGGRRAGARKIPVQIILKWIKKKKIRPRNAKGQFKSMTLNQLAFVIQRSIFNIGIRPRNILKKSFQEIDKLYKDNVESGIQEIIDSLFKNINDEVGKTSAAILKITPKTIKAK